MGGTHSELCNFLAKQIWNLAQSINLYIHATHIPCVDNVEADHASRFFRDDAEIMMKPSADFPGWTSKNNSHTII